MCGPEPEEYEQADRERAEKETCGAKHCTLGCKKPEAKEPEDPALD